MGLFKRRFVSSHIAMHEKSGLKNNIQAWSNKWSESSSLLQKSYLDRFPFSSFYSKTWLLDFDFLRRSSLNQFHLPSYGFWLANPFMNFYWRKGFDKRFLYNWEGRNRWFSLKSISIYSYTSLSHDNDDSSVWLISLTH